MTFTALSAVAIHLTLAAGPPAAPSPSRTAATSRPSTRRSPPAAPPTSRPAATRARRLAAWITKINPKATRWAPLLARRILVESERHSIPPAALAAIAWIESDYQRGRSGRAGEVGLWQLRPVDSYIPAGWDFIRARPAEFTVARRLGAARPWRRLDAERRRRLLDDLVAGTYLAALEISAARRICYRMRNKAHRVGRKWRPRSQWYAHQRPGQRLDVFAHYNSGPRPPRAGYKLKLRRRACLIAAHLAGRRRRCPRGPRVIAPARDKN